MQSSITGREIDITRMTCIVPIKHSKKSYRNSEEKRIKEKGKEWKREKEIREKENERRNEIRNWETKWMGRVQRHFWFPHPNLFYLVRTCNLDITLVSMVDISWLNLLISLPDGVASNQAIVACTTLWAILSCSSRAARRLCSKKTIVIYLIEFTLAEWSGVQLSDAHRKNAIYCQ